MWEILKKLFGQVKQEDEKGLGAILDYSDDRDIDVSSFQQGRTLPTKHISNTEHLLDYDQGSLGTCVAHAFASLKQYQEVLDGGNVIDFSRRFIYHFGREYSRMDENTGQGLRPREAAKVLSDKGVCLSELHKEKKTSHEDYTTASPTPNALENALDYRVSGYAFVRNDIDEIKTAIINNGVVTVSLPVDRSAWDKKTGKVKKLREDKITGRHYVLLYGYDRDTFFFKNSWGQDWGNSGNGSFEYADYKDHIRDMIVFTDIPQKIIEEAKGKKYVFKDVLKKGMSGEAVKQLQKRLTEMKYYASGITGFFGERTQDAVMTLQINNNLFADGIVGAKTNAILNGVMNTPVKKLSLVEALIQVESGGNDNAIGDHHLQDKAYGCLQIRKPCIDDVNKIMGTKYTAEQMLNNRQLSVWVFEKYIGIYATALKLGRVPTDEDRARIWNGGPMGYKKDSTIPYWERVEKLLT